MRVVRPIACRIGTEPPGSATVEQPPDITFIVAYRCPRCHAALEARTSESQTWLRCPKCGRASLPPEHMREPRRSTDAPGDDVLVIGPLPDDSGITTAGTFGPVTH